MALQHSERGFDPSSVHANLAPRRLPHGVTLCHPPGYSVYSVEPRDMGAKARVGDPPSYRGKNR